MWSHALFHDDVELAAATVCVLGGYAQTEGHFFCWSCSRVYCNYSLSSVGYVSSSDIVRQRCNEPQSRDLTRKGSPDSIPPTLEPRSFMQTSPSVLQYPSSRHQSCLSRCGEIHHCFCSHPRPMQWLAAQHGSCQTGRGDPVSKATGPAVEPCASPVCATLGSRWPAANRHHATSPL